MSFKSTKNSISIKVKKPLFFDGVDSCLESKETAKDASLLAETSISFAFGITLFDVPGCIFDFSDNIKLCLSKKKSLELFFGEQKVSIDGFLFGVKQIHTISIDIEGQKVSWSVDGISQEIQKKIKPIFFDFDGKKILFGKSKDKNDFAKMCLYYFATYEEFLGDEEVEKINQVGLEGDIRIKTLPAPTHYWFADDLVRVRDAIRTSGKSTIDLETINLDKFNLLEDEAEYNKIFVVYPEEFLKNHLLDLSNNKVTKNVLRIDDELCLAKFSANEVDEFTVKRAYKHIPDFEKVIKILNYQEALLFIKKTFGYL